MKILVLNWQCIKNPFGGGAEVHLHEIFSRVASRGHEVTLFCCEFDGCLKEETIDGIRIIRKGQRNTFNFGVKKEYRERFSKEGYDIVIDDINKIPFYTPRFVCEPLLAISHHFFGISIFREAGLISGLYVYLSEWLVNFIYKNTPFVVVSESTLDEFIERGFDRKNFSIVMNAIEQNNFPMAVQPKYDFPCVVYFGRLKKYKSVDHLVRAFAQIHERFPEAQLHFIGRGDFQPELERLAEELGVNNKTIFHGFVSEEDKVELLSKSHIIVNTSMKEGWGITNIEANGAGTPVVSANVPGLRDSVKEGQSGLLYEYGNIDELASKIELLLSDKQLLDKLSQGAVDWAKEFSWDKSAEKMIEVCEKVIRGE
jgi:glycosyltransferase involved in cell wall biosynthesis